VADIEQGLTDRSAMGLEDEAIDDAANRPFRYQSTGSRFRLATLRGALSALHTAGLPTRLFGVALSGPFSNADERTPPV
jgi:hypothetical protein